MRTTTQVSTIIHVELGGGVPDTTTSYVHEKIERTLRRAHEPVPWVRGRVLRQGGPAARKTFTAQANADIHGRPLRVQVAATTATAAADRLVDKLSHRLERFARHWEARRGQWPSGQPDEGRQGSPPAPESHDPPVSERAVRRRKTYALTPCTVDRAVDDLEAMDYRFHLFIEFGTGQDSVVFRSGDGEYRLAQVAPEPRHVAAYAAPVTLSVRPASMLTVAQAVDRLDITGRPYLFFLDTDTARGSVLYRRYDGHYALITPRDGEAGNGAH